MIRHENVHEIGIDEAGRGCLAGPVIAASFCPGVEFVPPKGLNDSKKMSHKQRQYCYEYVIDNYPEKFGIGNVPADRIDQVNILNATMQAMQLAVEHNPEYMRGYLNGFTGFTLLVDGNQFKPFNYFNTETPVKYETVVKGDSKFESIAMASVMAKVYRDVLMDLYAKLPQYEMYGWDKNKSYCTPDHIAAVLKYGRSDLHRKTFRVPGLSE